MKNIFSPFGKFVAEFLALATVVVFITGCGSTGTDGSLNLSENVEPATGSWSNLLNSKSYSGYIAVMFKEGTDVRLRPIISGATAKGFKAVDTDEPSEFVSLNKSADLRSVSENIAQISNAAVQRGLPDIPEEKIATTEGMLYDWNLFYKIKVENAADAEKILTTLHADRNVRWAHPVAVAVPIGDTGTPDISGEQTYLQPNETYGGLNVVAGWNAGATGSDVMLIDAELYWNFNHENLSITPNDIILSGPITSNSKYIQHGTAVAGILAGNGSKTNIGIKGIASDSTLKLMITPSTDEALMNLVLGWLKNPDGTPIEINKGSVIVIEIGYSGPTTPAGYDCMTQSDPENLGGMGCIPPEVYASDFAAIAEAVNAGYIVVEGAANGGIDLASSAAKWPNCGSEICPDLSKDSSGAIMVAASQGAIHERHPTSNCGTRVDLFAWGQGVVTTGVTTTGFGDDPISDPNDINRWYTKVQFNSTSAATAIVGGVVAQVQSYLKKVLENKSVYLNNTQMRDLLATSGIAQTSGTCNIGKQPDVGAAIQLIDSWQIPNVDMLSVAPISKTVVSGIRYDMDGDGRADLISFSRDGKWFIDLSSVGPNDDHFGEWDVVLNGSESINQQDIVFPVVHDYNSDGRADLAYYNSTTGELYIKFASRKLLSTPSQQFDWDVVIDYSGVANWKKYSRPFAGDYNGDNWLDFALQTPDGYWLVDHGGYDGIRLTNNNIEYIGSKFGAFDKSVKYLSVAQLDNAPAWAYLPFLFGGYTVIKSPDGISEPNQGIAFDANSIVDWGLVCENCDNDVIMSDVTQGLGLKYPDGSWDIFDFDVILHPEPHDTFGDVQCRSIPADYDGDGKDDRAVLCGNTVTWKIAYSSDPAQGMRVIESPRTVGSIRVSAPLPAFVYPGGVKYQDVLDLFDYYKLNLKCTNEQACTSGSEIDSVVPPIGPYFAECVKYWGPANECWGQ